MNYKRIIFMGTPQFSATVLKGLLEANYPIIAVVTQPDKKVGRKQEIQESSVKKVAKEKQLTVIQPNKIKEEYQAILDLKPDLIITCAYGQIIPSAILDYCLCINIHASLLPAYRGGAPIHYAILKDEQYSGITIMKMVNKMDAGGIWLQQRYKIEKSMTTSELFVALASLATTMIVDSLKYLDNQCIFIEQEEDKITYAYNIKKSEEKIDVTKDINQIDCHIRSLLDTPAAYVIINEKKVKIFKAEKVKSNNIHCKVLGFEKDHFLFGFQNGYLKVYTLQVEGKAKMDAKDVYNGIGRNWINIEIE